MSDLAGVLSWARDEAELVTELQAGSDEAFDWLVTHFHASVYSVVFGMLGETADAADVTQEVFLKAYRGIRSFRQGSSLKTWLYRIGVREALNYRRWNWRHRRQQVSIDAETDRGLKAVDLQDQAASPFDEYATHEIQAAVRGALGEVPEVFRSAVILRDLEGLSYEEVAEVLDVSVGTVKSRILRGRQALREVLAPMLGAAAKKPPAGEESSEAKAESSAPAREHARRREARPASQPAMTSGRSAMQFGSNRGGAR